MKKQILLLITIGLLLSCNSNSDTKIVGNWKLVQMSFGNFANSQATGSEMEWQENYQLRKDGTFEKSRDENGVTTKVSGTYKMINKANEVLLELNFNKESKIIGSCTSKTKETMIVQSDATISNTWNACDGPSLKYKKVN